MSTKKHPDYKQELQHLKNVKLYIENFISTVSKKQGESKDDIKEAFEILDFLDSSQSYITILVNARYLDHSKEMMDKVIRTKDKPYFSRIDFQDDRDDKPTNYYIGKVSLFDEDNVPLIIDWRSPIASLYYDGRLGDVSYEANEGKVTGKLYLKRQYSIENGELKDFFDVDITANDELLQASLRDKADNKLKDIVSTIQAEQNKIIRADLDKPLIVQGTVGSGKTTIALHRIAYLIYTYEKYFNPNNFMIIAPNRLFLDYISDVLPELDVEEARQTTFTNFCLDLLELKNKFIVKRQDENLSYIIEEKGLEEEIEALKWASAFKGSLSFKNLIDSYLEEIELEMLPKEDIILGEEILMSKDDIEQAFFHEYTYLPIHKRLDQIKKKLNSRAKQQKELIIENLSKEYEQNIETARQKIIENEDGTEIGREKVVALIEERDELISKIQEDAKKISQSLTKNFKKKNALTHYKELLKSPDLIIKHSPESIKKENAEFLADTCKKAFKEKKLESEDLAPLLYLKAKLEGFKESIECSNAVIDEAQDYNLFEFYVLKHVLNTHNFTLLGDLSQGVHSYRAIHSWDDVSQAVFSNKATQLTLEQSYRTTIEIMELANQVLKQGVGDQAYLGKPVVRRGDEPDFIEFTNQDFLIAKIKDKVSHLLKKDYQSIAIIGKTLPECKKLQELLAHHDLKETSLLAGEEEEYPAGVVIIPAYAAKGLEFDGVVAVSLNESYQKNKLDTKLLYVAMTRALHNLSVYYMKDNIAHLSFHNQSNLIQKVH